MIEVLWPNWNQLEFFSYKIKKLGVSLELIKNLVENLSWTYGAVISKADIQKMYSSTFNNLVQLVAGLLKFVPVMP
jgi:hypothetical protein